MRKKKTQELTPELLAAALGGIQNDRKLSNDVVEMALKEALSKAYRKHIEIPEAYVKIDIDQTIRIIPQKLVVEEVEDDELEVQLDEIQDTYPDAQLGQMIDFPAFDFTQFERADVMLAKNVMKQKIREAEKQQVYEAYCDKVDDLVTGTVETVEDKFVLVNIGQTLAMMKKSYQIPGETYTEGQRIQVVITEVNKETKGAQVLVSRATPVFVRRLFEREVPEIYNGIIEMKAIAREPGERTKMAVYSHNENIDPIGACIGPRGARVQAIIQELHGEKIDIFEWSDNIATLIQNALAPSTSLAVYPNPDVEDGLVVVVPDNQLSLAIGKRGKNARLAVKLAGRKIDIKSESEMLEAGIDFMALAAQMENDYLEKKAQERAYQQQRRIDALKQDAEPGEVVEADFTYEADMEEESTTSEESLFASEQAKKEQDEMEEAARLAKALRKQNRAESVTTYTSKFEALADASKTEEEDSKPKKKADSDNDVDKKEDKPKDNPAFETLKPIYTEEELAEIEEYEELEENKWDEDVDYEEYDEYYD